MSNTKTHKYHVVGMHCKSCVMLTESELIEHPEVENVCASLEDCTVEVTGNFGEKERHHLVDEFSSLLKPHGYSLALDKPAQEVNWSEFKTALPLALVIIFGFVFLQKLGIVNLVNAGTVNLGTAFLIGIVASLSTCMAVVGGLVLSLSATFAKEGSQFKPQAMFHVGRLAAFFILGGVIGMIGSAFALNFTATFILGMVIGLVMLVMGINLLDTFPWSKKLMPSMPKFVSRSVLGSVTLNHTLTPLLVGVATFFLPCGFTQAMQLYTLTTGSFIDGAMTMFTFALGTLPVLALVSFSSFSIGKGSRRGVFFKTAGIVVILFALMNILNSLAVVGIIPPFLNF